MKVREIILDFTSLLDVIMILLFWFILNYQQETTRIRDQAAAAQEAAVQAQTIAEEREAAAQERLQTAEDALDAMDTINERQASILKAMLEYRQGRSLNLTLVSRKRYWYLDVSIGEDEYLGRIEDDHAESLGLELREMLQDAGIADDATVFCVLSYDSSEDGSRDAYHAVIRKLKEIQLGNNQFSYTQVDRAVPDDEE